MTKKELSQLYYLNREIEEDKRRLEELRTAAVGGAAKITGMPHVGGTGRNLENVAILIAEAEQLLDLKIKQSIIEYNRLNRYIQDVEDTLMRQILSMRYVNGLSWVQVAMHIGGGNTEESVKKQCYWYLRKTESCPECPANL